MQPVTRWVLCALAAGMLAFAPTATATAAGPPADYTKTEGLSQPDFAQTVREQIFVPMADGKRLYVEVVRPKAPGPRPVILEASPYHGTLADRDGTTTPATTWRRPAAGCPARRPLRARSSSPAPTAPGTRSATTRRA